MLEELPAPKPTVNQIEVQPWYQQRPLTDYCQSQGIAVVAFCPLVRSGPRRMNDPVAVEIAKKHRKDVGQVLLRWSLQHGYVLDLLLALPHLTRADIIQYYSNSGFQ